MMAYLYLLATAQQEFSLPACLAYDVAFRKKAARFRLTAWGQLDPQLYAKAFTGTGKAKAAAHCSICLETGHSTAECSLYTGGPAKKSRVTQAGPRHSGPTHSSTSTTPREICYNFNRGRCTAKDCSRAHTCSFSGCGGPHPASRYSLWRTSSRKP